MITPYSNVWPKTLSSPEGDRLVIAVKHARLSGDQDFLDAESARTALELAKDVEWWSVSASDLIYQLRQVKSHFDDPSTYYLCRTSSDFAANRPYQPNSIFTNTSFYQAQNGDGVAASRIFYLVAGAVIKAGADAKLAKQAVVELRGRCSNSGDIAQEFNNILTLYTEGQSFIQILDNKKLNKPLEALAKRLSTYIATTNKSAVTG
ncbi:hypothetical protein KI688_012734 [Linnemannia hyalina]|uniref:Uncharacterized protein n=1 Tax=Linnemannia hyalina TaxID=64524 RepID=A0A9P8BVD5_9FUNG|nr:hypothetical protein KI688_012734 [Linnemannia hyalina]